MSYFVTTRECTRENKKGKHKKEHIILAATGLANESRTCYRMISGVSTGTEIAFRRDGQQTTRTYDYVLREDNQDIPYPLAAKQLREYIEAAVQRSLAHFDSLDLLVSGGLDTAVIAYEASRLGKAVRGYHWTWELPVFQEERRCAQRVAAHLHIPLSMIEGQSAIELGGTCIRSMQGEAHSWDEAIDLVHIHQPTNVDRASTQQLVYAFARDLASQGWIVIKNKEALERIRL